MTEEKKNGIQIAAVNIKYGNVLSRKIKNRPDMSILDLPENIVANKNNTEKFYDQIESFTYNTLTKKYGAEVTYCQIYIQ